MAHRCERAELVFVDKGMETLMDANDLPLVYIASASQDENLRKALEKHFALSVTQHRIRLWHQQQVPAGADTQQIKETKLTEASIILLLLSADFMHECYAEMKFARLSCPSAIIIPIRLRTVDLQDTPIEGRQCITRNGLPIDKCRDRDAAFQEIVGAVREALSSQSLPQKKLKDEREQRLQALLVDHRGFMQDRLANFVGRQRELADIQQLIQ